MVGSFFKRLFSSRSHRAEAAEAKGDLEGAAALYADAGDRSAVARIHRLRAQQARDLWTRIDILRLACSFADAPDDPLFEPCRLDLVDAITAWVEQGGVVDRRDRALFEEAAEILLLLQRFERAGDIFMQIDYRTRAAKAYEQGGCVEKIERAFEVDEAEHRAKRHTQGLLHDFEMAVMVGNFLAASRAITAASAASPQDARLRGRCNAFQQRMPEPLVARLTLEGQRGSLTLLGHDMLTLGRDASAAVTLHAPGVSRIHAQLVYDVDGLVLEDLDSKNGASVDGQPCIPVAPLALTTGSLALGERCELAYRRMVMDGVERATLLLEPRAAMARHARFVWGSAWTTDAASDTFLPPGLHFVLRDQYWHMQAHDGIRFDGETYHGEVLLRRETVIELADGVTLQVQ